MNEKEKGEWIVVSEFAKRHNKTRVGVYWMIKHQIIPPEKVRLVKVKDLYQILDDETTN